MPNQSVLKRVQSHWAAGRLAWRALIACLASIPGLVSAGNFFAGTSPANVPWPGGVVPYEFTNTLTAAEQETYLDGLREWELAANVTFVPHTTQTHWILFTYDTNGFDNYSGTTNPQVVSVSSLSRAQVCHEMGHSFGFEHENVRPDAPNFILVLTNNIYDESSNIYWFTPDPTSVTNGPYDYESVMHLGWDFESDNFGVAATQQPKPPNFPKYQYRMGNLCLSPGDRAALAYLYGPPAVPLTNVVTTTADWGPTSLRAAIYYATDHPGSTVRFNIPVSDPGYSNGVYNIHLTGHLPPLVANGMVIDGSTQPGFAGKPLIVVDGSQILPNTFTSNSGLLIYSSSNQVNNVSFSGFNWNGLTVEYGYATNNTIAGCWLGVDPTGTNAAPNAYQGVLVCAGAGGNTIGGTNALARNVISGNTQYGVFLTDSNTTGNVVLGNYLGTDASGSNALANGYSGVFIGNSAGGCAIGGTNAGAGNVISANAQYGIYLTNTMNNVIAGNTIGLNAGGETALPNQLSGIGIFNGAQSNLIGGARNVISGNAQYGIFMSGPGVANDVVAGNYIGADAAGTNSPGTQQYGVGILAGANLNTIGGAAAGAGNVLSGNSQYGLFIANPGTSSNWVQGNLIGTTAAGTTALSGCNIGVGIFNGATANVIGGTVPGAGNVISSNLEYGIDISDAGTSNNLVLGNLIGTGIAGTNALGNVGFGIGIWSGASGNIIGGTSAGARNVISGTTGFGYGITIGGANGNVVQGNYIGTDIHGEAGITNMVAGVALYGAASNNIIGGSSPGAGNLVSGNYNYGVYLSDPGTAGNWILGNNIGTDATGTNALPNNIGVAVYSGATNNVIGLKPDGSGLGNTIAFSTLDAVQIGESGTVGIAVRGNSIFSNAGGIALFNHGNNLQNYPVITNAFGLGGATIVLGTLSSQPSQTYLVDVYRNLAADPSGYGQGRFYLGKVSVNTDGSGNGAFALTNAAGNYAGQYLSATATDPIGDTSQFGADVLATNAPLPSAQFTAPPAWLGGGFVFNLTFATNFGYHIQATTNLGGSPVPWVNLTNFTALNPSFTFTDRAATNFPVRFYRAVSP